MSSAWRFAGLFGAGSLLFSIVGPILVAPIAYWPGYPHWFNFGLIMAKMGLGFAIGFGGFHCYEKACFGPAGSRPSHAGIDEFSAELEKIRQQSEVFYWVCMFSLFFTPLFSFVLLWALLVRPFVLYSRGQGEPGLLQRELGASWAYFASNLWSLTLLFICTLFGIVCSFIGLGLYHYLGR